jgi:protein SCO1/2
MMKGMRRLAGFIVLAAVGCHTAPGPAAPGGKHYPLRGTVVRVNAAQQLIELKNEEIPGFMAPMTMEYKLTDPAAAGEMHPGDTISATLLDDGGANASGDMRLADVVILTQAQPDYKPAVQYHVPTPGDLVPDFTLLNQSGKTIDLHRFRGRVLAMTFIYTRCPLTDYCPRMSRNFAQIDHALQADPGLYRQTHLLSVSFDPAYDTPQVLRLYGGSYTGRFAQETFQHWDFAAPPVAELPAMEQYFSVGVTPGDHGTLQHSLSTVVIGKDGKVVAFWPTNDWTPAEVLARIKAAAG